MLPSPHPPPQPLYLSVRTRNKFVVVMLAMTLVLAACVCAAYVHATLSNAYFFHSCCRALDRINEDRKSTFARLTGGRADSPRSIDDNATAGALDLRSRVRRAATAAAGERERRSRANALRATWTDFVEYALRRLRG